MNSKKSLLVLVLVVFVSALVYNSKKESAFEKKRKEFAVFLENHPYTKRQNLTNEELKAIPKKDRPDLAFEQDFLKTVNPQTKEVSQKSLVDAVKYRSNYLQEEKTSRKTANSSSFNWESRGPKTVAGRVRAMMFDPNDSEFKRVFAGGVSGGIWKNDDITDAESSWSLVYPEMSNFAISAMDFDPVNKRTFYAGTGEGWGNFDAVNGAGIWKSTDGGVNWGNLENTIEFEFVYDLVIRDEGSEIGVVYAAMRDTNSGLGSGIFRSVNGGQTWVRVSNITARDLELAADNKIWVGTSRGEIYTSVDGENFEEQYRSSVGNPARVDLATAQSNTNIVYALIANGSVLGEIVKTTDNGANWITLNNPEDTGDSTIPNSDFTRGQAWYDLIVQINPENDREVYIGGINMFKSSRADVWFKVSSWNLNVDRTNSVKFMHADQHNILFRPNSEGIIFSTDGGIYYSSRSRRLPSSDLEERNLNFNITQYYSGAIDPVNPIALLGGAQDNGTSFIFEPGIGNSLELLGGDGGFCFIDQTAVNEERGLYYIASTQFNNYFLNDYTDSNTNPRQITLIDNGNGTFINPADYDDDNNILYSFNDNSTITTATLNADYESQLSIVKDTINVRRLANEVVTHIRVSSYNKENRKVYLGTRNGRLLFINANNGSSRTVNAPDVVGAVSCIEFGESEDEILLTYSNYGVESVWYTSDGAETWINVEGNLPDIPVRWSLFNPLNRKQVILATEVGVWKTDDITAENVVWEPASNNMGSVRVDMLQYRASDNLVLAATHGRGMFTTNFTLGTASVEDVISDSAAFTVYPTVSKGDFTVFAKNNLGRSNIVVFDIAGRQVHKQVVDFNAQEKQEVSINVNTGIYIVNIIDEKGKRASKKIVIE
ncbi:T9SS type A sorting domain-containing protein [uncultured Polaribacter sp.]|uniref:T9SS type A sorting domain-containing protein n=1 Tax=uncultured Polaribacter sp. TaxID=174711 RepID=UPI00263796BA|nr:T9SS type A sorting domain-containing protein [uncultured Polaribacter sp.]